MTVKRGLWEALVLYAIAAVIAAIGAGIWTLVDAGDYLQRFGIVLMGAGALLVVSGGSLGLNRLTSADARAWLGAQPEYERDSGTGVLTGVGVFLFVTIPLVAAGSLLAG